MLAPSGEEGLGSPRGGDPTWSCSISGCLGWMATQVAATIRSTPGLEQTWIVAVTASAMAGDRERIAAAGFDGYIQKPIEPETFVARSSGSCLARCAVTRCEGHR